MADDTEKQPSSDQIAQLVECMTEIITRVAPSHHEALHHIKSRRPTVPSPPLPPPPPAIFHRISVILSRGANPTMGELSKALSLPLSTTTRMVDMGEGFGFVQRQPDAEDGRLVRVALTDEGLRFHKAIVDIQTQDAAKVLGCLTPEERGILLTLLRKVAGSIERG